MHVSSL